MGLVIGFFVVLAALIATTASAQRKTARWISAAAAFAWACLMFLLANLTVNMNHNVWYSNAAKGLLESCVVSLEQGRQEAVLGELRHMKDDLKVTYEFRGNFRDLAERTTANLTTAATPPAAAPQKNF